LPIRIYTLAKQLKLDSKVLVDICTKAGVTGKGSALASLTDEELATVTAFMNAGKGGRPAGAAASAAAPAAPPAVLRREDYISPGSAAHTRIPVLPPPPKPAPPKKKPDGGPLAAAVSHVVKSEPPKPAVPEAVPDPAAAADAERLRAEQILREQLERERQREREREAEKARQREKEEKDREKRNKAKERERAEERERGPAIKLAPLPPAARMPTPAKRAEPAPQKPDIKLPLDAIRAGKAGTKPLSEHIRKHEQKRIAAEAAKASGRKGAATEEAPAAGSSAGSRERPRRGVRVATAAVPTEEEGKVTLGGREQRQLRRKKAASVRRRKPEEGEDESATGPRRTHIRRTGTTNTAAPRRENVVVELPCTVRSFSEAVGISTRDILAKLLQLEIMSNIAAALDKDTAELLAAELGVHVTFHEALNLEQKVLQSLEAPDDPAKLEPRPPIVTFLGHVDHGKTSLLDRIIGIDVAAHEKGGITQHIRAYRVDRDGGAIAFVDTPGHEAFTEMRARGANVTDIAVLVVAAEDGVMPQTEEAISHAKAAEVPIVVALNKIDLPGANVERAYQQLSTSGLLPSEWGGDTEVVKTSATTGEGIDKLLETLLTVAELHEYKADPTRPARGTCLEAELHEGRGAVAKLLVRTGTLHVGDVVVCGAAYGRVKAMYDTLDPRRKHKEASPSMPVNVTGLSCAPAAGDRFYVLSDITEARELAEQRAGEARRRELGHFQPHVTLETLFERLGEEGKVQTLNIILRADVQGSIEAIRKELQKLQHPEVQIKILQAVVGGVTEADVHLAHASDAIIIGFSVVPDEGARMLAEKLGVQIRRYDIIYQVTDDLRAALEGMLKPEKQERELGRAFVQQVFHISRIGSVAGCRVLSGVMQRDARLRIIRDSRVIGDYAIDSLKREKDDAREVRDGLECGIRLAGFNDIKQGDVLEAYKIEEIARTL
jgi:translation initiation factor IF-2